MQTLNLETGPAANPTDARSVPFLALSATSALSALPRITSRSFLPPANFSYPRPLEQGSASVQPVSVEPISAEPTPAHAPEPEESTVEIIEWDDLTEPLVFFAPPLNRLKRIPLLHLQPSVHWPCSNRSLCHVQLRCL